MKIKIWKMKVVTADGHVERLCHLKDKSWNAHMNSQLDKKKAQGQLKIYHIQNNMEAYIL